MSKNNERDAFVKELAKVELERFIFSRKTKTEELEEEETDENAEEEETDENAEEEETDEKAEIELPQRKPAKK